jgi:HPr kinase/phosphorylase
VTGTATRICVHGSSVAVDGQGVLILGASGSGKSALALQLLAFGAQLIADDQTLLTRSDDMIFASAPEAIKGQIEARGIGLLAADAFGPQRLLLVVDLDQPPATRLPDRQVHNVLGLEFDLICGQDLSHLAVSVLQYLKGGRIA